MGVTIHYRGQLDDLARVEEFEDRVLDVVAALGGHATIWRSFGQLDPTRIVRGLLVQLCPGQETLSLLISPEGQLLNLFEIKEAERGPLAEAPCCFVKTQFGSLQGHVAVVSLLDALRTEYFSDLVVSDESGYYEHRDPHELARKLNSLGSAILALGEALESSALSPEAAEDPEILALRIERVAELVARKMRVDGKVGRGQDELGPEGGGDDPSLEDLVRQHSQVRREAELRQERLMRRIEEGRGQGLSTDDALMKALREVKQAEDDAAGDSSADAPSLREFDTEELGGQLETEFRWWLDEDDEVEEGLAFADDDEATGEQWRDSLEPFDSTRLPSEEALTSEGHQRHPAQQAAEKLYFRLTDLGRHLNAENGFYHAAINGSGDLLGGLVQATGRSLDSRLSRAAVIVQLKRALKGLAFCRGGLYGLRSAELLDEVSHREMQEQLRGILEHLHDLLAQAWSE